MTAGRCFIMSAFASAWLAACNAPAAVETEAGQTASRPMRIVSLDFCADQYVLKLVDQDRILALSPDADADYSYMRESAKGLRQIRPVAEDALILRPDLIVRSYGGGPNAAAFFEQAGVPVLNLGWAADIDAVKRVILDMAEGLGEPARGEAVVAEMTERLAAVNARPSGQSALYMTSAGATTGPGSLVHEMLSAAGLENFQAAPGWRPLPLERLAYEQPDLIAAAFINPYASNRYAWSAMRHPIARAQLVTQPSVPLEGAWTVCSGWFLVDAVEALASGAANDN